jgi:AbrB family looped-hinge helix DNA binding protein
MRSTIDSAGRVVIPKALREKAGLSTGSEIEVNLRAGAIEITLPEAQGTLVRENGVLVWVPAQGTQPVTPEQVDEAIRSLREERSEL